MAPEPSGPGGLRDLRPDSLLAQALRRQGVLEDDDAIEPELEPAVEPERKTVEWDPEPELHAEPEPEPVPRHRAPAHKRRGRGRSTLLGLGVGLGVGVAAIAIAFSIIAIPLYMIASTEPGSGLDRDLVRKGLFFVALPFGAIAGTGIGVLVGVWYGRGGRLPVERSSIHGG
jgi:hypothetical protein